MGARAISTYSMWSLFRNCRKACEWRYLGSEFPCAVVIVHKSHVMHHRNLFYTGVTRAKEATLIVGDRWSIANCARKRHLDERRTFLSFLLAGKEDPI